MPFDDTIVLKTFSSRIEAEIVAGLLDSEGIDAILEADDGFWHDHSLHLTQGVRLVVFRDEEARAREILRDMEAPTEPEPE